MAYLFEYFVDVSSKVGDQTIITARMVVHVFSDIVDVALEGDQFLGRALLCKPLLVQLQVLFVLEVQETGSPILSDISDGWHYYLNYL